MLFGGGEALVLMVFFWVLSIWVFYMVIKAAVRNGILEAEVRRARLQVRATAPQPAVEQLDDTP